MTRDADQDNALYAIEDALSFATGPGGLREARVTNEHAEAVVSLHGAHVR